MQHPALIALLNNAALLLVLSVIYELTNYLNIRYARIKQIISGLLIALVCIVIMSMPLILYSGVVFDIRFILVGVTALIFGPLPALVTMAAAVAFRITQGGAGILPEAAAIVFSAVIGSVWRFWIYPRAAKLRWLYVYAMGVLIDAAMVACIFLLPDSVGSDAIREISLTAFIVYPALSVLLTLLLARQQASLQLHDRLIDSEERFRLLFDKAPLGYQALDINGRVIDVNQQWLDTLGYTRNEVIGKWFGNFLLPASRKEFSESFAVLIKTGKYHSEFEIMQKNGNPICITFDGNISCDSNGDFKQTHCILKDITEQKRAEADRQKSERKYRLLHETMAQGIVYQAADGRIISANPAAERILGLTIEQLVGKTSMDPGWKTVREDGSVLPGSEHPAMIALRTGKPVGPVIMGIYQPQLQDEVWITVNAIPIYEDGETMPSEVYTTIRDITAERNAYQQYRLLFSEMVDAFALHEIICDDRGIPIDYRFLAVNPAFEEMTGLKAADIVGKTVLDVLPGTESYWIETYGKVALAGESVSYANYSAAVDKYFRVMAYRPAPMQFACTFSDDTTRVRAEEELKRVLSRLKSLLSNSPSPIIIFNSEGDIAEISASAEKILGLSDNYTGAKNMYRLGRADIVEKAAHLLQPSRSEDMIIDTVDIYDVQGAKRYFESRLFPIDVESYNEKLFAYIGTDITDRLMAEQSLKESEEKYSSYIRNAPYAVFVVDAQGNYIEANPAASTITGYSREQLLKMSVRDITAEEPGNGAMYYFNTLLETGKMSAELKYIHSDGSVRWWTVDAVKLSDNRFLGFSIDTTSKKQAQEELFYQSSRDYLTGLYNRRYFEKELNRLDEENQLPLSVMIGDINGLKLINDAFGHAEGDKLIAESAKIIDSCCRAGDISARIGGDEFAIIMPNTDSATALEVMQDIQNALSESDNRKDHELYQHSVSLGYATKENACEEIAHIAKAAEEHMYQRKLLEANSAHSSIVSSIKATMFEKSHETEAHAERLVALSKAIGIELNLSQVELDKLELLAALHDIGKVGIRDYILTKPDKLTDSEWIEMKRHPEIGYRIAMTSPELVPIAEGILSHQEWWDGSGYPQGLSGENIPLLSRIIAVVDAYDAMTNDRPYRKAMDSATAIGIIRENAGRQFDPQIAQIFLKIISESEAAPPDSAC